MIQPTDIAKVCHEVNRGYCESIGDNSQPTWEKAPEWQKVSAINGVNFHLENPDATPEDSHANWFAEKDAEGWVYGHNKNPVKKTHPCMCPYVDLPAVQRGKDILFMAVVNSMRSMVSVIAEVQKTC